MKYLFLSALLFCGAISHAQSTDTLRIDLEAITISSSPAPTPYQPSATLLWDIIDTKIGLTFDRIQKTATAREWIKLRPYAYATDKIGRAHV